MDLGTWIRRRTRLIFSRRSAEAQVDDELRFHLEMEIAERIRGGMAPDEARRTAWRDFGRVETIKDDWRDARPLAWLDGLRRDATFAWRGIRRSPAFSASVILVTALGIGATTAMFSVVNGVLLRPLPLHDPDRLYDLRLQDEGGHRYGVSAEGFRLLESAPGIERAGRYSVGSVVLTATDGPERLRTELVTSDVFPLLGVQPALGRGFSLEEERGPPVIVLSHELWQRRFAGDSTIIGRAIPIDDGSAVVVGVMPPGFPGARPWLMVAPTVWMPLDRERATRAAGLVLRVRPNLAAETVEGWLGSVLETRVPSITGTDSVDVRPGLDPLREITVGSLRNPLAVLFGGVCFVLLLVAVNVATLLLARGAARDRDLAVRRALGASRFRQIRHVLLESLMLALAGGLVGVMLAVWGTVILRSLGTDVLPRLSMVGIDWRVLGFAAFLACGCGLGAGLVPALVYGGGNGHRLLASLSGAGRVEQGSARWGGVRGALVVTEIALSLVLLIGAGLMLKGFLRLMPSEAGFEIADRLTVPLRLRNHPTYDDSVAGPERRLAFVSAVHERMRTLPGVRDVAITRFIPFIRESAIAEVRPDGAPRDPTARPLTAHHRAVSPNYFGVMGMDVRRGREFREADRRGAPRVVIVNETAARRWWPDREAVGRTLVFSQGGSGEVIAEVIGVVRDTRFDGLSTRTVAEIFVPFEQSPSRAFAFIVWGGANTPGLDAELRRAVWAVDPTLPIEPIERLSDIAGEAVATPRFYSIVMGVFAVIALVLSAAGIHSVLAYTVARRSREIGIRMALGAARRGVMGLVLRQGMTLAALGITIGVLGATMLTRILESVLFEVSPTDPVVFALTVAALMIVAAAACAIPALRAGRLDPLRAIKSD